MAQSLEHRKENEERCRHSCDEERVKNDPIVHVGSDPGRDLHVDEAHDLIAKE
jgi:hypothetical protein